MMQGTRSIVGNISYKWGICRTFHNVPKIATNRDVGDALTFHIFMPCWSHLHPERKRVIPNTRPQRLGPIANVGNARTTNSSLWLVAGWQNGARNLEKSKHGVTVGRSRGSPAKRWGINPALTAPNRAYPAVC